MGSSAYATMPALLLMLVLGLGTAASGQLGSQPWYETLPAVAMDYKVHIDPGKEDCYFQYVNPGATFYVSFQVLRGGDGKAGFAVRNPAGEIVHPYQWKANADYQDQSVQGGYYSVCVDNQFSRFAGKLVNLYITVIRYDQWERFAKELETMNLSVENVTNTLVNVEKNIYEVLQIQHLSRSREDRDYNLLLDNNSYVQNWSLLQVVVIIATTILQVFFVRRLFNVKSGYSRARI
ncbi:transmembrane emp24 domain-containing protein 6 [Phymastichus coffea]|uniref:transmembrane emp24 domain-containing protein 6 n=1 Tax=Phymastichus coffea TaxID=108790 RepID=UPI00273CA15A|nr:transmembrane emp24 domain-containing protein 6 [Phymastichus coffea]